MTTPASLHVAPTEPSLALWMVAGMTGLLGAWAYVEYVRRVRHDGPVLARRELVFGTVALGAALWGAIVVSLSAQGLPFDLGFHPARLAASLAVPLVLVFGLSYAAVAVPRLWMHALLALVFGAGMLATAWAVLWSVAPAPGLAWRREPLGAAGMVAALGYGVSLRMVIMQRRGSPADSPGRRFGAALLLAVALAAGLELVALSSDLSLQVAALHSRERPEMAVALAAGGAVPLLLVLMLVDQRMQARIRAANRHRRIHRKRGPSKDVATRRPSTRSVETPGT